MSTRETREHVRNMLREGDKFKVYIAQKRPYTAAFVYREEPFELLGAGFAKVNLEDPWVPDYGKRLALEKAITSTARKLREKPDYLHTGTGSIEVETMEWRFIETGVFPPLLLDGDLNKSPQEWLEGDYYSDA